MVVVIKGGYDVMYSAHDGIHMPPVMSYIVGVMSSQSGCDYIYSGYEGR